MSILSRHKGATEQLFVLHFLLRYCTSPLVIKRWLGAESNRRHVDFQSTALPTELPSRFTTIDRHRLPAKAGRSLCKIHAAEQQRSKHSVPLRLLIVLCSGQNRLTLACHERSI